MKVQDGIRNVLLFGFKEKSTDMFALIIEDCQIYSLEWVELRVLLWAKERTEMVPVLIGTDDTPPSSLKVLPDDFHNKK